MTLLGMHDFLVAFTILLIGSAGAQSGMKTASQSLFSSAFVSPRKRQEGVQSGQSSVNESVNTRPAVKIIGGTNAALGDWPWQALVIYEDIRNGDTYLCGGTLISSLHVLTAGHCAEPMNTSGSKVKLGTIDSTPQSTKGIVRGIAAKFIHESYSTNELENPAALYDIAVLELDQKVPFGKYIKPICLRSDDSELTSKSGTVTGWGEYNVGQQIVEGANAAILMQAEVPFVDRQRCSSMWEQNPSGGFPIADSQLCAGAWMKGTGRGDSGGPLQVKVSGTWFQVGITSFGDNSDSHYLDQGNYPGVYTRVASYYDFISRVTNNAAACNTNNVNVHPSPHISIVGTMLLLTALLA